jgi:hypothetical protein
VRQLIHVNPTFVTLTAHELPIDHCAAFRQDVCCSNISAVGLVAARADWDIY